MRITVTGALSILARTWAMSATARPDINAPNTRDPAACLHKNVYQPADASCDARPPQILPRQIQHQPKTEHCHESAGHLYDDSHYPGPLHSHDLSAQGLCLHSLCLPWPAFPSVHTSSFPLPYGPSPCQLVEQRHAGSHSCRHRQRRHNGFQHPRGPGRVIPIQRIPDRCCEYHAWHKRHDSTDNDNIRTASGQQPPVQRQRAVPKEKAPSTLVQKSFSWILDAMYTTDPSTPPVSAAAMQSAALPLSTTPKKKEINI